MAVFDPIVMEAIESLHGSGYVVTLDLVTRTTKLPRRDVSKSLTSLTRRGMITPRHWGGPPGSYVPVTEHGH